MQAFIEEFYVKSTQQLMNKFLNIRQLHTFTEMDLTSSVSDFKLLSK